MVQLRDEAGRINPNSASPELLEALLGVTGSDPGSARQLALAIREWVTSAESGAPQQGQPAAYRAAGLDYGPPGAPLESMDELGRVLGRQGRERHVRIGAVGEVRAIAVENPESALPLSDALWGRWMACWRNLRFGQAPH